MEWEERANIIHQRTAPNDKKFLKFLQEREYLGYMQFDDMLYYKCFDIYKEQRNENDHLIVIYGATGKGKSRLAMQLATCVDPQFSLGDLPYEFKGFVKALRKDNRREYQALQLDEGGQFLYSKEAQNKQNKYVNKLLNLIRQLNFLNIVCIPNVKNIDKEVRTDRIDTLIEVTARGKYNAYIKDGISFKIKNEQLGYNKFKVHSQYWWQGWFAAKFPEINGMTEAEYKKNKLQHTDEFIEEIYKEMVEDGPKKLSCTQYAKEMNLSRETVLKHCKSGLLPAQKIGDKWLIDPKALEIGKNQHFSDRITNLRGEQL